MPKNGNDDAIRKPPIGAVLSQHKQGVRGLCGWCGLAVDETTPVRGWKKFWHDTCAEELAIISQPDRARAAVFARDKGICSDCGEDWSLMSAFRPTYPARPTVIDPDPERYSPGPKAGTFCLVSTRGGDPYVELLVISLWHADHVVPLWKVFHLPPLRRLEYFKLANLVTLCHRCHKKKSKSEESEKAHLDRMADRLAKRDRPAKPKRLWAKRPFPKRIKP